MILPSDSRTFQTFSKNDLLNTCPAVIWPTSVLIGVDIPPDSSGESITDWTNSASPLSPFAGSIVYGAPRIGRVSTCSSAAAIPLRDNMTL